MAFEAFGEAERRGFGRPDDDICDHLAKRFSNGSFGRKNDPLRIQRMER